MSDRFPVILGLATALASASAFAGDAIAPVQAAVRDVDDKQIVAVYGAEGRACSPTMMVDESPVNREAHGPSTEEPGATLDAGLVSDAPPPGPTGSA
jgi:hypothetical protein